MLACIVQILQCKVFSHLFHYMLQDKENRWGSIHQMIERILEQQQAICSVIVEDHKNWDKMPSDQLGIFMSRGCFICT